MKRADRVVLESSAAFDDIEIIVDDDGDLRIVQSETVFIGEDDIDDFLRELTALVEARRVGAGGDA